MVESGNYALVQTHRLGNVLPSGAGMFLYPFIYLFKYTLCIVYYGASIDGEKCFEVKLFVILY